MRTAPPVPHSAASSGAPSGHNHSPPLGIVDLADLSATLSKMTSARAWDWVRAARQATPSLPARQHLPGSSSKCPSGATYGRRLAAGAALLILTMAADGHAAAQILALHIPLLLLRRTCEIPGQVQALARDELPHPADPPDPLARPADPTRAWCQRLLRAHEAAAPRRLFDLAVEGPDSASVPPAQAVPFLDKLFPANELGELRDEACQWHELASPLLAAAQEPPVTRADLLKWARSHISKAPDMGGWTGRLVLDLDSTDTSTTDALARFMALPPAAIADAGASAAAYRTNCGVLLARANKDPRPISAPSLFRKVRSAIDARAARPVAAAFCERRGQLGLSRGGPLLAYSMMPHLIVQMGGTTSSADNSMSFQRFTRSGLLTGAATLLSSPEARLEHPVSATAAARLLDTCVFDSPVHRMPRTSTVFPRLGETRISNALAQGCSSSPLAEAVTLACSPSLEYPLAIRKAAHDDWQASGLPGCSVTAFAPPAPFGGSVYNTDKSVAVGPLADFLVQSGLATRSATFTSVFGAPVGDVHAWVLTEWVPKLERLMTQLRLAFTIDPEAAILTAHAIKGPGASAAHWLRSASAAHDDRILRTLEHVDNQWVLMWLSFGGYNHATAAPAHRLTNAELATCWDRVYGSGANCLGHLAASWCAPLRCAEGRAQAWPTISQWVATMGPHADWRSFAKLLGAPAHTLSTGTHNTGRPVEAHFAAEVRASADALRQRITDAAERVRAFEGSPRLSRGAQSSAISVANGHMNFWVAALGRSNPLAPAGPLTDDGHRGYAGAHIALLFGLSVWSALDVAPRPEFCRHCGAAALPASTITRASRSALPGTAHPPPVTITSYRHHLDDFGLHISVCSKSGALAGAKQRHDKTVRRLAELSKECGRKGRYHDGPIFRFGPKQRPADVLQNAPNAARYPGGQCLDFTSGLETVRSAADREKEKVRKFADQLSLHPEYDFRALATTHDGDVAPQTHGVILDWGNLLASRAAALHLPNADFRSEVSVAAARAMTRAILHQFVQWKLHERQIPRPRSYAHSGARARPALAAIPAPAASPATDGAAMRSPASAPALPVGRVPATR